MYCSYASSYYNVLIDLTTNMVLEQVLHANLNYKTSQ